MYMGLYNSYTRQRIKPTTSGTEFKDVTVKLSKIDNIMIIMVFIFTILLFLYFLLAFYLSLCILTGSWIKLFINKKGKK